MLNNKLEVLAPAGDEERFGAAVNYGADAVYLGRQQFGMRASPMNFDYEQLVNAVNTAHAKGIKVYVTCNTLPRNNEIPFFQKFVEEAVSAKVDALIVADIGLLSLVKKYAPDMDYDFRYSLGFNAKNLSESSPAAMLIYKADAQRKILFLNQLCAELFGYDSINDMLQTSASFTAFVDAASCNTIDSYLQDDSSFQYPELHIQCKDGSSKEVFCTGRLSENEHFGSICFCFLLQM